MRFFLILGLALAGLMGLATAKPGEHEKIVACYWGTWSFYRTGDGQFDVDDIDPTLCTHGFYGFADLNNVTWKMVPYDPWYDQAPGDPGCVPDPANCNYDSYRRFVALKEKNPDFVPMLSIGGWNSGSGRFSMMAKDSVRRKTFIDSVVPFLQLYGFEGLDFDWEYPGDREGSDPDNDKENFSILIEELGAELKKHNLLLSAAVSPSWKKVDVGYDVPRISKVFDFINVMCYDYHGWWPQVFTGHNSPMYPRPEDNMYESHPGYFFNTFNTIMHWIERGAPREKLVMGLPLYGRGFQLNKTEEHGLYCPAKDGIPAGPYTLQVGIWGFQEIQQALHNDTLPWLPGATPKNWDIVVDDCYRAPYAVNGPYWIGYDDLDSFRMKAKFVNHLDIAGAMVWSVDTDDFRGDFHDETFPLLRVVHDTFANGETYDPETESCTGTAPMCDLFTTTTEEPTTTTPAPTTTTTPASHACTEHNEVIAYPGNCHKYFMCIEQEDGGFKVNEYTCGDWVFDPHVSSCVDPDLPGNENLCDV